MKLLSTFQHLFSHSNNNDLPINGMDSLAMSEHELNAICKLERMIQNLKLESPSSTSISIIMEYARQKASLK